MNDGFVLDWGSVKDCVTRENSERYCGYNATAEEYLCFCKGMLSLILMGTDINGSGSTS